MALPREAGRGLLPFGDEMPYEPREIAPSYMPLGEGYELASDRRGPSAVGERELECIPTGVFKGRDDTLCTANDDSCGARRAKGTEFCAGHLRSRGEL